MVRITIIYDNTSFLEGLVGDWGFSALVEAFGKKILFDTGARGDILLEHMEKLSISPLSIDEVVISHDHWDHTGGLDSILKLKPLRVYIPYSAAEPSGAEEVVRVSEPITLFEVPGDAEREKEPRRGATGGPADGIFSTGELSGIEQSLVVVEKGKAVVVVGCSHSGVGKILSTARKFAPVKALVGGLHGFDRFELLEELERVVPTHCTQFKEEIKSLYPEKYLEGGAGRVLEF